MARVDPVRFATVLATLLVAHNVADHVAQTDHQAANKANSWAAMAGHIGGYQLVQAVSVEAVLALTGLRCTATAKLLGALISASTHAFLDRRWPVKKVLEKTGSPNFAGMTTPINGMYQADQALHHGCLLIAALIMAADATRPRR